jgi:plastocyanin
MGVRASSDKGDLNMSRAMALLLVLIAAALGIAACGGDDDDGDSGTTATETTETTPTTGATGDEGGGATVEVSADPGGQLKYEQASLTAKPGKTTFEFTNESTVPHDFDIEQDGTNILDTEVITDDKTEGTADLEAGEYTFYCSVAGHREAGMEGTLTVE